MDHKCIFEGLLLYISRWWHLPLEICFDCVVVVSYLGSLMHHSLNTRPCFLTNFKVFLEESVTFLFHSRPENFKKSRKKNWWIQINPIFLVKLHFPVQKLIFGHFWNCNKWILLKKIFFRKNDLFDLTSFLVWTFLNFLAHCPSIGPIKYTTYFEFFNFL